MSRARRLAGWLPAALLVPAGLAATVVGLEPDDELAAIREQQPVDLGTTWVYEVRDHGEPSGTRVGQVVQPATTFGEDGELLPVYEVVRRYTDYPGQGPRTTSSFLSLEDGRLTQHAIDEAGRWFPITPPIPAYEVPARVGATWEYDGMLGSDIPYSSRTELTEIVDVEVGGRTFTDCAHFVNEIPLTDVEGTEVLEEWTCPGIGTVRTRDVAEATDTDVVEELVEFHGVAENWYAEGHEPTPVTDLEPVRGETTGFDTTRAYAVPEGRLGRELAWSDLRYQRGMHPPASDGEVLAYAERDGTVSLRTTGTGEDRWRVQLRGPVLVAPLLAGDAVVVTDSLKQVWALSVEDGRALWVRELSDVASASPAVVGDQVVVPTDDGTLTALSLTDGSTAWETGLGGPVRWSVASDGDAVLVGDTSGTLTALDPEDGTVTWSTSFDAGLSQGPLVADDLVMVLDLDGVVHAFSPDGEVRWQSRGRGQSEVPMAAAGGVVLVNDFGDLTAYSTSDGTRLWKRDVGVTRARLAVVGDEAVAAGEDGTVHTYGLRDGRVGDSWTLPAPEAGQRWGSDVVPALVGTDLVLTTSGGGGNSSGGMFAYPTSGEPGRGVSLSLRPRPVPTVPSEPPVLAGDDVVLGGYQQLLKVGPDGTTTVLAELPEANHTGAVVAGDVVVTRSSDQVQALSLADGSVLWERPGGASSLGSVPATDGTTVFYGIADLGLAAVDLASGRVRWATPVVGQLVTTTPLVLPDGDVVYGGGGVGRYDGATGAEEWRDTGAVTFGPAAYAGGRVFALTIGEDAATGALTAYDAGTGDTVWSQPVVDVSPFQGVGAGDGVVAVVDGTTARVHDAATGAELWSLELRREAFAVPVVHDGRVLLVQSPNGYLVGGDDYRVTVHDARSGRLLASWQPGASVIASLPKVGSTPDGRLLVPDLGITVAEVVE